jgi:hypothetical protein
LRGCRLGIDLNPFEEHELESSKRQSLSILDLSSILKHSLAQLNGESHVNVPITSDSIPPLWG